MANEKYQKSKLISEQMTRFSKIYFDKQAHKVNEYCFRSVNVTLHKSFLKRFDRSRHFDLMLSIQSYIQTLANKYSMNNHDRPAKAPYRILDFTVFEDYSKYKNYTELHTHAIWFVHPDNVKKFNRSFVEKRGWNTPTNFMSGCGEIINLKEVVHSVVIKPIPIHTRQKKWSDKWFNLATVLDYNLKQMEGVFDPWTNWLACSLSENSDERPKRLRSGLAA